MARSWMPHSDSAFGPDGRSPVGRQDAEWSSKNGINHLKIRGYEYAGHDEVNQLPGGHGPQDPEGYSGHSYAEIKP